MKNKYRILKIGITIILLGVMLSFSLKKFSQQKITDDKISVKLGEDIPVYFIDEEDVRNIIKNENPSGLVGDLDIPALEKKINLMPAVDSANIYLNLNGQLNLDIKQRIPIFRLNIEGKDFYVDEKGIEFPTSKTYSHPCMLVTGKIQAEEYPKLVALIKKINTDDFCKKYFIGVSKHKQDYYLLTNDGKYKLEIGDLENIDFKVKGFKTFVEKYLVFQDPEKYKMVSVKYQNQIVTTLNPNFKENDSILKAANKDFEKTPSNNVKLSNSQDNSQEKKEQKPKAKSLKSN